MGGGDASIRSTLSESARVAGSVDGYLTKNTFIEL